MEIDANGRLGTAPSSARYKRDIAAMGTRRGGVLQLRPVTFAYRDDALGETHYGLIAEEVAAVYPELVTHTPTGEVQTVRYPELIPLLLNELQLRRREVQTQRQDLTELPALRHQLLQQQRALAELRALLEHRPGTQPTAQPHIPPSSVAVDATVSLAR